MDQSLKQFVKMRNEVRGIATQNLVSFYELAGTNRSFKACGYETLKSVQLAEQQGGLPAGGQKTALRVF